MRERNKFHSAAKEVPNKRAEPTSGGVHSSSSTTEAKAKAETETETENQGQTVSRWTKEPRVRREYRV